MRYKNDKKEKEAEQLAEDALRAIMGRVDNEKDALRFVDQVLTKHERVMIGRRVMIAQMILSGMKQIEIDEVLKVSPNTLSGIRQWIDGTLPEYEKVLKKRERLASAKKTRPAKHHARAFTFASLREKYPMHFLLFNVIDKLLE